MALPVLDGNQSATTLSSVVTGGEHIVAHSVVSLGSQAISDITSAFPATQTVAGTVTARALGFNVDTNTFDALPITTWDLRESPNYIAVGIMGYQGVQIQDDNPFPVNLWSKDPNGTYPAASPISADYQNNNAWVKAEITRGTVTVGNSVTIGSLPAISGTVTVGNTVTIAGTVTANPTGTQTIAGTVTAETSLFSRSNPVLLDTSYNIRPVAGRVSGGGISSSYEPIKVSSDGTLSIAGTVTANLNSALVAGTAQIGSVTASISSFATSVTARLVDISGTAVSYAATGTAGSPSSDVISVQGVSGGTAVSVSISSVTIGAVPNGALTTRFGSVTTANTAEISSAVTLATRKYLLIQNVTTSSNVITVGIGFTPTTTQGIQLAAGAGITFESSYIPTGAIYILSSVTASPFTILEA